MSKTIKHFAILGYLDDIFGENHMALRYLAVRKPVTHSTLRYAFGFSVGGRKTALPDINGTI